MMMFLAGMAVGFILGIIIAATMISDPICTPEPSHNTLQSPPRDELDEFLDGELGRKKHNTSTMWGDD